MCIFAFIAAHAVGQGAVIWVYISEIFPNRYRAQGQTLGSSTHWIFAALLTTFFPRMVTAFPPGDVFLFFCGMMVLQLIWVKTMVVETKGVPLEQVQERLGIAAASACLLARHTDPSDRRAVRLETTSPPHDLLARHREAREGHVSRLREAALSSPCSPLMRWPWSATDAAAGPGGRGPAPRRPVPWPRHGRTSAGYTLA